MHTIYDKSIKHGVLGKSCTSAIPQAYCLHYLGYACALEKCAFQYIINTIYAIKSILITSL